MQYEQQFGIDDYVIIENAKDLNELNKSVINKINEQNDLCNFDNLNNYSKQMTILYGIGHYCLRFSRFFVPFI